MNPDFRRGFEALRLARNLHPEEQTASATFEAAAETTRHIAQDCLPLGIAIVMHLYPLCTLRWVPLPWWSAAGRRRARLLRAVDSGSLVLANAGSERAKGAPAPLTVIRTRDGVRITGSFDYVSLAHVADIVLFSTSCEDQTVFCAADLRCGSVSIGESRFQGSMRLSDTCSVTFDDHLVRADRCIGIPTASALECMSQYQRGWFQLLLAEGYLARIHRLHSAYRLHCPAERIASFNELAQLREYSLRLLDEAARPDAILSLAAVADAIKLRVSLFAQATAAAVRKFDATAAAELEHIQRQPTSDDRILASIAANLRQTQGCKSDGSPAKRAGLHAGAISDTGLSNIAV
jgi:alkylation response protein AidB-like acyl-CoA dehydrogenase